MFKYHVFALLLGTILEFFFGRIYSIWNPMETIDRFVKYLDRALLGDEIILVEPEKQKSLGWWLIALVVIPVFLGILFFTLLCYEIAPWLGVIFEAVASYFCLDYRRLYYGGIETMEDFYSDGISSMKHSAGILMGQEDTSSSEEELTGDVIRYIANEASDSVMSPIFVMFLFGPVGGFLYKTLDIIEGRIGNYKCGNWQKEYQRYRYFGEPIVAINKVVDWLPSRFSGALTVFAAKYTFGDFNGKNARYIHLRDRYKAVSAFAGALEIGFKGLIGEADKQPEPKDIRRAVTLLRNCFMLNQFILVFLLLFF
ncbi:adenosylcobinamide-phosphate synthase [Pseudobutyrivibrio sp. YE44]|uniref:cobalamin biosynthesis protein CobD/CbiB n=1 Tax=Pseudobutyrivibrio sp. YE44 TaxID=1520802 RepID=UPI00088E7DC2|nr:cobalamin biosynthesis protein [Pseudobutyrivibrio sp. YE44]SDB06408.1 adenosylcobinamide-phosphate synthase [Pseudobutyrivibrio sp. YE44]